MLSKIPVPGIGPAAIPPKPADQLVSDPSKGSVSGLPPPVVPPQPKPDTPPISVAAPQPQTLDVSRFSDRYSKSSETPAVAVPPSVDTLPETVPVDASGKPDPKANHAYAQLRASVKRYEKELLPQLEQAKAEEARLRKAAEDRVALILSEKEKLEIEKTGLLEQIGRVSLMESPKFKEKYGNREADIRGKLAKVLVRVQHMEPQQAESAAEKLLKAGSDELVRATEDLHPSAVGAVEFATQEWAAVEQERQQEIADWRGSSLASGLQDSRDAVIRSAEDRRRIARAALDFAKAAGNPVFSADAADAEAASKLAAFETAFQSFVQSASEDMLVKAAAEGFTAPFLYARIAEQDTELSDLRSQVQSFRGAYRVPASQWAPAAAPVIPKPAPAAVPAEAPDSPEALLRRRLEAGVPRPPQL